MADAAIRTTPLTPAAMLALSAAAPRMPTAQIPVSVRRRSADESGEEGELDGVAVPDRCEGVSDKPGCGAHGHQCPGADAVDR
jgi:hypothetical protein